ncbi:MAG: NUDIX domain-containing protein, partial [Actinobacteria bacterium]|nr:NUDIX domain-containing protein [Actinomycetota bacterium]
REREFIASYKKQYESLPYPPIFVTADAVVIQSGHVLMIKRRSEPGRGLWALPGGFVNANTDKSVEDAAIRELREETGITSSITKSLGVIDFWFMAGGKRIHKTVHHFIFAEVSGELTPQVSEVDEVSWFPLAEIVDRLAYPDEKKLIARSGELGA